MNSVPLACNMDVFTSAERDVHVRATLELYRTVQEIRESTNGYEFSFSNGSETISQLAAFISRERLCCPFLEFTLRIEPNGRPISLRLAGPEGTREFLREEFSEAFL